MLEVASLSAGGFEVAFLKVGVGASSGGRSYRVCWVTRCQAVGR